MAGKLLIYEREAGGTTVGQRMSGDLVFIIEKTLNNKMTAIKR